MNLLNRILANKSREVLLKKKLIPKSQLEQSLLFPRKTISISQQIKKSSTGIIAEHKRRSPSQPNINQELSLIDVIVGYENAKASALSVLTDNQYFGGSLEDLLQARAASRLPLLRKEFIIDEYQILEAKAFGADAILLIAACLEPVKMKRFAKFAQNLQLEVLLEVHCLQELEKNLTPDINLIGVNNRNLETLQIDLETSHQLCEKIPYDFVKISESGINSVESLRKLQTIGYQGFLIGEYFMKTTDPGYTAQKFIDEI